MSGAEAPVTSADEEVGFRKPGDDKTQPSFLANVVTHRAWSAFFLWVILANTVTMAMMRPTEPADSTWNHRLEVVELVFLVVFTIELAIKLIALGMEFFQDNWNNLDFVIVSTGYLVFLPGMSALLLCMLAKPLKVTLHVQMSESTLVFSGQCACYDHYAASV
jgi:hypothetical protein|eukprot:SAG25_NODE_523_length_7209_cov_880.305204_7_plen_163_part_00